MFPARARAADRKDTSHRVIAQALQQHTLADHAARAEDDNLHLLTSYSSCNLMKRCPPPACEDGLPLLCLGRLATAHVIDSRQLVRSRDQLPPVAITKRVVGVVGLGAEGVARASHVSARIKKKRIRR